MANDSKQEIIKHMVEYKERMIEFFVFNKKNKVRLDAIRDEIITEIDWPFEDDPID